MKNLLPILFIFLLASCTGGGGSNVLYIMDVESWNSGTMAYIDHACDSINKAEFPPSKVRGGPSNNLDLIKKRLENRHEVLNQIKQYLTNVNDLYVLEEYNRDDLDIMFSRDGQNWLSMPKFISRGSIPRHKELDIQTLEFFRKCEINNSYPIYTRMSILSSIHSEKVGELVYSTLGVGLK